MDKTYKLFQSVYPYLLPRCLVIRLGVPLSSEGVKTLKRHCHILKNRESEYQQNKSEEEKDPCNPTAPPVEQSKIVKGKRSKVRSKLFKTVYYFFFIENELDKRVFVTVSFTYFLLNLETTDVGGISWFFLVRQNDNYM